MKSCVILFIFALSAVVSASVTTESAVHKKMDNTPHNVLPEDYEKENTDKGGAILPGSDSRTIVQTERSLSKKSETVGKIGNEAEISFKNSEVNDNTATNLQKTDRLDLQTSSRVTCGRFTRCNYNTFTRCWSTNSTVWYARWFLSGGVCGGKVYISGTRVCIRGGYVRCCARIYYMRA